MGIPEEDCMTIRSKYPVRSFLGCVGAAALACTVAGCGSRGDPDVGQIRAGGDSRLARADAPARYSTSNLAAESGATFRDLGDGRAEAILGVAPSRYRDDDGAWKPVQNDLVRAADGGWENRSNTLRSFLPAVATGAIAVDRRDGALLSFVPAGMAWCDSGGVCSPRDTPSPVLGVFDERVSGRLVYPGVHPDVDEEFRVLAVGLKHDVVLTAPPVVPATAGEDGFVSFAWGFAWRAASSRWCAVGRCRAT